MSRTRPRRLLVALLTGAALAGAGCAGPPSAAPAPTPPTAATTTASPATSTTTRPPGPTTTPSRHPDVPAVTRPRETRGVDPCQLLTDTQKAEFGIPPDVEKPVDQTIVRRCLWNVGRGTSFAASIGDEATFPGVSSLYYTRDLVPLFEPGTIDGYPMVRIEQGLVTETDCTLNIGVADDRLIEAAAIVLADGAPPACQYARRMASYMIANLPLR